MEPLVNIDEQKCRVCYTCVRACPVNAIKVPAKEGKPEILHDRCIGCGYCITACSPKAIFYRESISGARNVLRGKTRKVILLAPSIAAEFEDITDYRKLVQMLRAMGFDHVHEVSFGVDLVARQYENLLSAFKGKYYLTSACPVIVSLVEKYHPGLIDNLAPIISPMIATTKVVREMHGKETKIVYAGPCIENKNEIFRYNETERPDAVITFTELRKLFNEFGIQESKVEYSEFDRPHGYKGAIYPISSGLMEAAGQRRSLIEGNLITADGKRSMIEAIEQFEKNGTDIKCHFNLFSCEGCLMGPGTTEGGNRYNRRSLVTKYVQKKLKSFDKESWHKDLEEFRHLILTTSFKSDDQRLPFPGEDKINEILEKLELTGENEIGCNACGYESCRDFAEAIAKGLATPEMCFSYSMRNQQNYIRTLKQTNEKLAQTQAALKESEQKSRMEQETAKEASATIQTMLQKIPSALVIVDRKLKIIHSNKSFIDFCGEDALEINEIIPGLVGADLKSLIPHDFYNFFSFVINNNQDVVNKDIRHDDNMYNLSVFPIKKGRVAGAVIRDMSVPEVQKEEIINRVTDVIDKNLGLVQKIGFLLGEGASETVHMLNSIIESYKTGGKKNEK
ncbi:MAG: [Fe-Fe] hydrogenase large subunit C-terminal domain-containing protein [Bacteroidales bacterium]